MEISLRFSLFSKITKLFKCRSATIHLLSASLCKMIPFLPSLFTTEQCRGNKKHLHNGLCVFIHAYSEIMEAAPQTFKTKFSSSRDISKENITWQPEVFRKLRAVETGGSMENVTQPQQQ